MIWSEALESIIWSESLESIIWSESLASMIRSEAPPWLPGKSRIPTARHAGGLIDTHAITRPTNPVGDTLADCGVQHGWYVSRLFTVACSMGVMCPGYSLWRAAWVLCVVVVLFTCL
jgi:hypothetical protein